MLAQAVLQQTQVVAQLMAVNQQIGQPSGKYNNPNNVGDSEIDRYSR